MIRLCCGLYAILLTGAACGGSSSPTSYGGGGGGGGGGNPPPPSTVDVGMQEYSFGPSSITVKVGTTVRWTNNGTLAHTTTSDMGSWDSGPLSAPSGGGGYGGSTSGGTYSRVFSTAGTFPYHCSFHVVSNGMKGTVTVTP